jgi:hypothetical protein
MIASFADGAGATIEPISKNLPEVGLNPCLIVTMHLESVRPVGICVNSRTISGIALPL